LLLVLLDLASQLSSGVTVAGVLEDGQDGVTDVARSGALVNVNSGPQLRNPGGEGGLVRGLVGDRDDRQAVGEGGDEGARVGAISARSGD